MYKDIANNLIHDILNKKYQTKLPTEKELMATFHASRTTIRKSIELVFSHGLLRRVQGSGYYIIHQPNDSRKILNMSIGLERNSSINGGPLTSRVIIFDKINANKELATNGNVEINSELYRVIRLRYFQDHLYNLEEAYFPTRTVPYIPKETAHHSIFAYLRDNYHMIGSNTENYVHLSKLNAEESELLNADNNQTSLCLDAINYLDNGRVFNFSRTHFAHPELTLYYHTNNLNQG